MLLTHAEVDSGEDVCIYVNLEGKHAHTCEQFTVRIFELVLHKSCQSMIAHHARFTCMRKAHNLN